MESLEDWPPGDKEALQLSWFLPARIVAEVAHRHGFNTLHGSICGLINDVLFPKVPQQEGAEHPASATITVQVAIPLQNAKH